MRLLTSTCEHFKSMKSYHQGQSSVTERCVEGFLESVNTHEARHMHEARNGHHDLQRALQLDNLPARVSQQATLPTDIHFEGIT